MDWLFKAGAVAGAVLLVTWVAQRSGRRLAGVVAGLPIVTAPALALIAHEQGVTFAVDAAVASVAACAMLATFALGYAMAAHRGRCAALALLCGLCGALATAIPAELVSAHLADSLALALACCAIALAAMPGAVLEAAPARRSPPGMLLVAGAAGALAALAAAVGPAVGAFGTGLLASLPVISASVAVFEHTASGNRAATQFLRGYVGGLLGKAGFGVVFALLAPRIGVTAALLLASLCACALSARDGRRTSLPAWASRRSE